VRKGNRLKVKKSNAKACPQRAPEDTADPTATGPVDMEALRDQLSSQVRAAAAGMVSTTIKQVNEGHYLGMKYLFEMIGLFPATSMADVPQEDSLAGVLLSRLGIRDEGASTEKKPIT